LKSKHGSFWSQSEHRGLLSCAVLACVLWAESMAFARGPVKITLDDATQMALEQNHNMLAARSAIQQSEAEEITANLSPNPVFFTDWDYLPPFSPSALTSTYLHDSTEADMGLSYLIERGKKPQHRLQAAQDVTAVTRSQGADNERTLTFQVASQFIGVQLAESMLDLAQQDLKS
jgi:outer membrane protein, heavy metal efflux system